MRWHGYRNQAKAGESSENAVTAGPCPKKSEGYPAATRIFALGLANDLEDANLEVKAAPQVIP